MKSLIVLTRYFIVIFFFYFSVHSTYGQKLIAGDGDKDEQRDIHLFFESNKGDSILYYSGFSVIFSYKYHLPRYVFNHLTVDQLSLNPNRSIAKRRSSFITLKLPNGSESATNADYYKSGYDRGHMVPAGDFVWNKVLKDETFVYTNINPQNPTLNRGIWANLEDRIRVKIKQCSEDGYVITGVLFNDDNPETIGPKQLIVPSAFFKVVYFQRSERMFAFYFDNSLGMYLGQLNDFQVTVDFLEDITGEDFFDLLDDLLEEKLESIVVPFDKF